LENINCKYFAKQPGNIRNLLKLSKQFQV